jgi:hypothetical protein
MFSHLILSGHFGRIKPLDLQRLHSTFLVHPKTMPESGQDGDLENPPVARTSTADNAQAVDKRSLGDKLKQWVSLSLPYLHMRIP